MNITDNDLHVWYSRYGWKASGKEGDYGIAKNFKEAVRIACDASLTGSGGNRPIAIHEIAWWTPKSIAWRILRVRGKGSSQLFQDNVP